MQELTRQIREFRDERDWKQYHHPKDLAMALSIEAAEVLEIFRFKSPTQIDAELPTLKARLGPELADCLFFILLMAHDCGIDMKSALESKMQENARKYPVELCRGKNLKYTEL
ncbi:nucleotide pyrophosphohydrolase [bacterium]|nr:nucleotide pyrophosphohydrolase [bacterium]